MHSTTTLPPDTVAPAGALEARVVAVLEALAAQQAVLVRIVADLAAARPAGVQAAAAASPLGDVGALAKVIDRHAAKLDDMMNRGEAFQRRVLAGQQRREEQLRQLKGGG